MNASWDNFHFYTLFQMASAPQMEEYDSVGLNVSCALKSALGKVVFRVGPMRVPSEGKAREALARQMIAILKSSTAVDATTAGTEVSIFFS